ncbi:hypothetical protein C1T31_09570 [Hanstruepera neustonica]|uniref:Uncharacterized protein n=1 Tax=Hanstruepera neustonica TaxID=1445657 RepID=A0A2K1DXJ4_9FLAO|nr:hypothetical protein [Hanstruepera neustonica]PNQ72754.1 hypothetical protein C1T31_09570 [Hanstruepera neustonica]
MKKLSLLVIGALIGALATYYLCPSCAGTTEMAAAPIVKPSGVITSSQAKVLSSAYNVRYNLVSDSIFGGPNLDNRSSWYSLVDMNNYLRYADSQATALGYDMDGIRIYLGAHPDGKTPGYTTMFMVPTGSESLSEGNSSFLNFKRVGGGDIPGGDGLDNGDPGDPPSANYPN